MARLSPPRWRNRVRPQVEVLEDRAVPCTINWINEAGGNWSTPANWDLDRLPIAADDVCIPDFTGNIAVTHSQGTDTVRSLTNEEALVLSGGSLTLADSSALNHLTLASGTLTGAGNLSVAGRFIWTGGTMSGTGTTRLEAGRQLDLTGGTVTLGRNFDNAGTVTVSGPGSALTLASGVVFNNLVGGHFHIRNDQSLAGSGTFNNQLGALVRRSATTGTIFVQPTVNNDGTVELETGTLWLQGGGSHGGLFTGSATAAITFGSGSAHVFQPSSRVSVAEVLFFNTSVTFNGTYEVADRTVVQGTTINFNPVAVVNSVGRELVIYNGVANFSSGEDITLQLLTLSGGTNGGNVAGSDHITVTDLFIWHTGTMSGTGTTTVTGELEIDPFRGVGVNLARTLNHAGQGRLIGEFGGFAFTISDAGVFDNLAGASFDIRGTEFNVSGNGMFFNHEGAVVRVLTTSDYPWSPRFYNGGRVEVQRGTLNLRGGGRHDGAFIADPGTLLQFGGGTHTFQPRSSLSAANVLFSGATVNMHGLYEVSSTTVTGGAVTFTPEANVSTVGDTLAIRGGTVNFNSGEPLVPATFHLGGGTLAGSDDLFILDTFTWSGGSMVGSGVTYAFGEVALSGTGMTLGRAFANFGTATWTGVGSMFASPGAVFYNAGTFDVQNDQTFASSCQATFYNDGTFQKTASYGTTTIGLVFEDAGTVDVQTGTVNFACQPGPGRGGSGGTAPKYVPLSALAGQDIVAVLMRRDRYTS